MSIATEAKDFVAYIRNAGLTEEMPTEFMALADAVDEDAAIVSDAVMELGQSVMRCPRCGNVEIIPLPCDVTALIHWFSYFRYEHARCKKP